MKDSKQLTLTTSSKAPYAPISNALQMPIALFECLALARKIKTEDGAKLKAILASMIEVVLDDPDAIIKLENLAENGYRMAFLPPEKAAELESV